MCPKGPAEDNPLESITCHQGLLLIRGFTNNLFHVIDNTSWVYNGNTDYSAVVHMFCIVVSKLRTLQIWAMLMFCWQRFKGIKVGTDGYHYNSSQKVHSSERIIETEV